jgi:hypothetical protein
MPDAEMNQQNINHDERRRNHTNLEARTHAHFLVVFVLEKDAISALELGGLLFVFVILLPHEQPVLETVD